MYFTDDSLLPENQSPLMITAAPYGPVWLPGDCTVIDDHGFGLYPELAKSAQE